MLRPVPRYNSRYAATRVFGIVARRPARARGQDRIALFAVFQANPLSRAGGRAADLGRTVTLRRWHASEQS